MKPPKVSIVIPMHATMKNGPLFLWYLIQSIMMQTFKDYEIVIVQEGSMPVNTNAGIKKAKGELIKIMYMDDFFAHPNSLQVIVDNFAAKDTWLVTGCTHQNWNQLPHSPHVPSYNENIINGVNTIGSPSVLTIRNEGHLLFDERLSFLLDCDLYKRYHDRDGPPKLINDLNVVIGLGDHQTSNTMPNEDKLKEFEYLKSKYATS